MTRAEFEREAARAWVEALRRLFASLADFPADLEVWIAVATRAPGVELPEAARKAYPESIPLVLRARSLGTPIAVEGEAFTTRLFLAGEDAPVRIPFAAVQALRAGDVEMAAHLPRVERRAGRRKESAPGAAPDPAPMGNVRPWKPRS